MTTAKKKIQALKSVASPKASRPARVAASKQKSAVKANLKSPAKPLAASVVETKKIAIPKKKALANKPVVKAPTVKSDQTKSLHAKSPATLVTKDKIKKPKLVRDSFTMPEVEYAVLGEVKKACLAAGLEVKKSQLLRLGVVLLKELEMKRLKTLLAVLPPLKPGRPKLNMEE